MENSAPVEWLSKAVERATRSARFCVAGCLPDVDPGIEVEGLGAISLPLKRTRTKELVAACRVAPYGKGERTLVNKKVRNTFELDPKKFRLSDDWNAAIADIIGPIAEQLGLTAEQVEARLYKLLVYEKGGFFLTHRDSEKHDRMVASLIVALPNQFEGGTLVVRHGAAEQKLTFAEAASGKAPSYAAFYADCEHEVRPVTGGVRLCLAYNLVLKPKRAKSPPSANGPAPDDVLATSLGSWIARQPASPLVFALEHHYTQRGLSLELLKGADRQFADLVVAAAEKSDCLAHLAQVSRHLSQFADDGSYERSYSRYSRTPRHKIEIGETYEDELGGTEWTDIRGKKQPWGEIEFDLSAIVSSTPIDDWKPTAEEFEGYTGNAGNTLDRWYHRSAIVVWRRDRHFEVIASSGASDSIPLFSSMAAKLARTPKKRFEDARLDCIRFARAIVAEWPRRSAGYRGATRREDESPYEGFLEQLLTLHDRDTIALFLAALAERDELLRISSFVLAACREFGASAFSEELKRLLAAPPSLHRRQDIPIRDVEWLAAFCCDNKADADQRALAQELCVLAADRFCEPRPQQQSYWPQDRREALDSELSLPLLLKALAASGCHDDLKRAIHFVQESPEEFSLDHGQVPCLKALIPWSRKWFGSVPLQLMTWLDSVRAQLEAATATQPAPPSDWSRPAEVACRCKLCAELNAFLADPSNEVGRIPAREDLRQHLIGMIGRHRCDVKHSLERKGSPHSLVLTKTNGAYDRALKRYERDRRLLSSLPAVE